VSGLNYRALILDFGDVGAVIDATATRIFKPDARAYDRDSWNRRRRHARARP
jgi:hypothetical protein